MKLTFIIIIIIGSNCFCQSEKSKVYLEPILISKTKIDPSPVSFTHLVKCKSKNGKYSIMLPSEWDTSIIMNNKAGVQAKDKTFKFSIFILAKNITQKLNPKEIASKEIRQSISDYKNSKIKSNPNILINGLTHNYFYADGKYYNLNQTTFIDIIVGSEYYYIIKLWTNQDIFENNFSEIKRIVNSFKEY